MIPRTTQRQLVAAVAALAIAAALEACRAASPPPQPVAIYRQVGSWNGRGNRQTETFTSETGAFRVTWETRNETVPGAGTFYAVFRSGDSGRDIMDAVRARGVDHDVEYVSAERPRWYYLSIESANVDWSITVDEEIPGQRRSRR